MGSDIKEVLQKTHTAFRERGITLSVAESCTGGLLSHYLTSLPGASKFYEAGVVSYSAASKKVILGIPSDVIDSHGMVSKETAREMAERMRAVASTDYAISTTGNLGPDVLEGKEKGLIYIGISREGEIFVKELRLEGDREDNKTEACIAALQFLMELVER